MDDRYSLKNVCDIIISPVDKKSYDNECQVKLCNYTDVYYNDFITNNINFMIATAKAEEIKKYSLYKGDVIITKDSETPDDVGISSYVFENIDNLVCGYHLAILRPKEDMILGLFLAYYLKLQSVLYSFYKYANGIIRYSVINETYSRIYINLPPLEEQKKITDILLLWDKAIEKTKDLIAEKEKYKKGLMQNLITGKKRLKGFKDEWKNVKLGEVCEIKTGKMDANAMKSDGAYPFFTCAKEIYNIDTYAFDTEALLISGNGNIGYIHYYNGRFNAYQRTYVLDKFSEYIIFVKYMLDLYLYNRILREKKVGSIPYIVLGTLYDMELSVPISICEQQAISSVLQKADEEIVLLNKQIELYTKQKKGLMQNLLTGKVRVK